MVCIKPKCTTLYCTKLMLPSTKLYWITLYCTALLLHFTATYFTHLRLYQTVLPTVLHFKGLCWILLHSSTPPRTTPCLYCFVLSLYIDKRRGVQGNTSMRSREFVRAQPEGTPETECWYFPVLGYEAGTRGENKLPHTQYTSDPQYFYRFRIS